ncbi:MAG: ATP-binding protein [Pseudomonadota bacterium]
MGLALILILVTLQFAGSRIVADRQEVSAVEINLSGRQRMLSQRIGWTLYRIADLPPENFNSSSEISHLKSVLAACVHLMESSHRALTSRDLGNMRAVLNAGRSCMDPEPNTLIPIAASRMPLTDGTILSEFTNEAWQVAVGETNGEQVASVARNFEAPLAVLLAQLNRDTLSAQETSVAQIRRLLSWNWFLIVALIAGEIVLIFRPMAKAVDQSINDLTQTNAKLTRSEARLQGFTATAAHQLWETDASHKLIYVAAASPDAKLVRSTEMIGRAFWELEGITTKRDEEGHWTNLRETLESGQSVSGFEFSRQENKFRKTWWRIHGQPVFSQSGAFLGYRGTALEITSEREAEERLRLSERMMTVGKLTAGIAHDFNNILAVIQGNAELLPKEDSKYAQERNAKEIVAAVRRGAALTSRLLSFGRVQRLSPEPIDMKSFLSDLEHLLNRTLGEDFDVSVALPEQPLYVFADVHQLEDAALNLAINARDAASSGGRLWIEASLQRVVLPLVEFTDGEPRKEFVKISFKDNGAGIPEEVQERIFEPFFTTKSTGEGSGLGLSMVYGFAHQSEGFLELRSVVGSGTTIDLYLPHSKGAFQAPKVQTDEVMPKIGKGLSALLVEDNAALRDVVRRQLDLLGFLVVEANDGGSALERIKDKGPFNFLLLDIVLPGGIDGVDVAHSALEAMPDASILFCTGFASDGTERPRQLELPGPVIAKPFSIDQLERQIAHVLENPKASKGADCSH